MSDKLETASLEGGLTFGATCDPYDGRAEAREHRAANGPALDFFGDPIAPAQHSARLSEEFVYPPFSVLNARDGWWQERKREWLALGIQSELGRGKQAELVKGKPNATPSGSLKPSADTYRKDDGARGD